MAEARPRNWVRDVLVIPLIVALVVAGFTYGLPRLIERGKELSYTIDGPTTYFDITQEGIEDVTIEINDEPISRLFIYRIRLWNSGDVPLANLPVRFVFSTERSDFEIFSTRHATTPGYEFGEISEEGSDSSSKRFVYELLNPGDEDNITFLTNDALELMVYARAEGLIVREVEPRDWSEWIALIAVISISVIASLLTSGIKAFQDILPVLVKRFGAKRKAA